MATTPTPARKTGKPATGDVKDATAAADAAVLDGVTAPANSTAPARRGRRPAATTTAKAPAGKAPAAKANGDKPAAKAPANGHAAGFAGYLTRPVADQMPKFRKYIERETGKSIAELAGADPDRLVQMISKGYRFFQSSDLNK